MLKDIASDLLPLLRGGSGTRAGLAKTAQVVLNAGAVLQSIPTGKFREDKAGTPPDFAQLSNWLAHPRRAKGALAVEDANHLAAAGGAELPPAESRACDCFYVVDSCYTPAEALAFRGESEARRWNVPLGSAEGTAGGRLAEKVLEQMRLRSAANASCFNRTCRVYAPAYRQAALLALAHLPNLARGQQGLKPHLQNAISRPYDLSQALELAYADVRSAFLRFVDDSANAGRPFVLAGHSQGVIYVIRLLQEEVEHHPARLARFVHAYVAGFGVPQDIFSETLHNIRPSASPCDIRSVSSWRTAAHGHPRQAVLMAAMFYAGTGWRRIEGAVLTTNPITWSSDPSDGPSHPSAYRGALWPVASNLNPRALEAGFVTSGVALRFGHLSANSQGPLGVRVQELAGVDSGPVTAAVDGAGMVRVPAVPPDSLFGLTERDWLLYHDLDFALFHQNLQDNVASRVRAWQLRSRL